MKKRKRNIRKDVNKALLLSLVPGLGFLYLEDIVLWLVFAVIIPLPLVGYSLSGPTVLVLSGVLYVLSIVYTYVKASETLRNTETYKVDPYYILCLSAFVDGFGQLKLKQEKKGLTMLFSGFSGCVVAWAILISKFGFMDMLLNVEDIKMFNFVNIMIIWLIVSIPIKILSMIDAYYSAYHLYVAKK